MLGALKSIFGNTSWGNFLQNFWPNLVADGTIAFIFGFLFIRWWDFYKRPKLTIVISDIQTLPEGPKNITLALRNSGKTALKENEVNYHLYIPHYLETLNLPGEIAGQSDIYGIKHYHFRQFNKLPLFPERQIPIGYIGNRKVRTKHRIYYHFSSIYGVLPRRRWKRWWYRKVFKKGDPRLELLPYVEF